MVNKILHDSEKKTPTPQKNTPPQKKNKKTKTTHNTNKQTTKKQIQKNYKNKTTPQK